MKHIPNKHLFQIGEIAEKAGVTARTVRYYMEEGFIEPAGRSAGGFYLFAPETAETVFFVQKLKDAGLALKDIKAIYRARQNGQTGNEAYREVLAHLKEQKVLVEKKIADYRQLRTEIEEAMALVAQCDGCQLKPTRENCESCPVVKNAKKIPLPVKAIL
jgi:MerR family Zn(II)-responsive transcriptional regulator of zntA